MASVSLAWRQVSLLSRLGEFSYSISTGFAGCSFRRHRDLSVQILEEATACARRMELPPPVKAHSLCVGFCPPSGFYSVCFTRFVLQEHRSVYDTILGASSTLTIFVRFDPHLFLPSFLSSTIFLARSLSNRGRLRFIMSCSHFFLRSSSASLINSSQHASSTDIPNSIFWVRKTPSSRKPRFGYG